jgi:hypothetical protein
MSKARFKAAPTRTRRKRGEFVRLTTLRNALTLWLMLAAAAQGVIAQGHVHVRVERAPTIGVVIASAAPTTHGDGAPGGPARDDPSTCALCQVLASGAAPLGPLPLFSLPIAALRHAVPSLPAGPVLTSAVTHNWTSRGPPRI